MLEEALELDRESECRPVLLPKLLGQVFHVTTPEGYAGISRDGMIQPNSDRRYPLTQSQSEVAYFRKKGCISLVDLRAISEEDLQWGLGKYYFLNPRHSDEAVFLLLSASAYASLIPWTISKEEGLGAMIVPEFEAGFQGAIPLSLIQKVIRSRIRQQARPDFNALLES